MNVETAHLWLRHVATFWESGGTREAQVAGSRARHLVEHLAGRDGRALHPRVRRARAQPAEPVERIFRDLSIYVRHDNDDQVLATIGKSVLGRISIRRSSSPEGNGGAMSKPPHRSSGLSRLGYFASTCLTARS